MIGYVDVLLTEWARERSGGYPVGMGSLLEERTAAGFSSMSDESSIVDQIVCGMINPWQTIVYLKYVHKDMGLDEKLVRASVVAPPRKRIFRGSNAARVDREERYLMGEKRFYSLLHQAHEIIDREFKIKRV